MENFPEKLRVKTDQRKQDQAFRSLGTNLKAIDFSSNDYLGLAKSERVFKRASEILTQKNILQNGSTGSRLLSGNSVLCEETEGLIAQFHQAESTLMFNSGYDANLGFFACVPQHGDLVFYDELIHASIRDGIRLGHAKAYKFKHNDLGDLKCKLATPLPPVAPPTPQRGEPISLNEIYVVTESVFSMDGDSPDLKALAGFCSKNKCRLIVDEAHAVGVFGKNGKGLVCENGLENQVFARIATFGKALGCHGAAVLGSRALKDHLINFCRSFVYTTSLPPHSVATVQAVYQELENQNTPIEKLRENIAFFKSEVEKNGLRDLFSQSNSAIQVCQIPGNENAKAVSELLLKKGFCVKPILSPTVPKGKERLRFCLHSVNSKKGISGVLNGLADFVIKK